MRRKKNTQVDSDDESSSGSDSSDVVTKRRPGRPPAAKNKKRRVQDDSDDNASPQPSTSRNGVHEDSESDSGSETPDSDYGAVVDRSLVKKKKIQKKRGRPPANAKQKKRQSDANSKNKKKSKNHSQSATSKKNSCNGISLDPKLVETLAQKCVYFLIIEDQKKYAIKRKAIVTHVFKDEDYSQKLYIAVIHKANNILKKTYGMELMKLENQQDSYLLINILRHELGIHDYVEMTRIKQQRQGLILYLVTVIYMNDNTITEDELTKSLKTLGIDFASKHPVFGDVKKYITVELVKQMYLNYECISKDPPKYEFTWGLRAKQEFDKMDLLQFACQIMDDTSPEDWKIQYKDAEKS